MPTISIYVNDEIYAFLLGRGKPSTIGKSWITDRYNAEQQNIQDVDE